MSKKRNLRCLSRARKIREGLLRRFSGIPIPAKNTIHAVLDRHGLVERRGRVRCRAQGTRLSLGQRQRLRNCGTWPDQTEKIISCRGTRKAKTAETSRACRPPRWR
jgi:hypothetical protein